MFGLNLARFHLDQSLKTSRLLWTSKIENFYISSSNVKLIYVKLIDEISINGLRVIIRLSKELRFVELVCS